MLIIDVPLKLLPLSVIVICPLEAAYVGEMLFKRGAEFSGEIWTLDAVPAAWLSVFSVNDKDVTALKAVGFASTITALRACTISSRNSEDTCASNVVYET